ncbi:MAG: glycosyltransferase [Ilumatobacteraceae bacterium]
MDPLPFVRVVVINYDGGQMTIDCLRSVLATDHPADRLEVVMVDNGSLDDVVERVRAELPAVRVIESLENTGFAGGCNLGIRAEGDFDHVALVNNDATVDPGWLRPLIDALHADPGIGAACPKILFDGRYQEAVVEVPDAARIGRDPRDLGVRVSAVRIDGARADRRVQFDEGFHPPEPPHPPDHEEIAVWTSDRARIRLRTDDTPAGELALRVSALEPRTLRLHSGEHAVVETDVLAHRWTTLDLDPTRYDVVNNVGSNLYANGFAGDRGFLDLDAGQYDEPAEVFAWCGGAVLLRGDYLTDVGLFDERLFLYYEDTDLSWRGRLTGWSYRYEPRSVVRHRHAQSSGQWSPTFRYYTERNRILVLAKNAPAPIAARAVGGALRRAVTRTVRDIVLRPLTLRMPVRAEAAHRWRVVRGVAERLPAMLRDRRRALGPGGRRMDRRAPMAWEMQK